MSVAGTLAASSLGRQAPMPAAQPASSPARPVNSRWRPTTARMALSGGDGARKPVQPPAAYAQTVAAGAVLAREPDVEAAEPGQGLPSYPVQQQHGYQNNVAPLRSEQLQLESLFQRSAAEPAAAAAAAAESSLDAELDLADIAALLDDMESLTSDLDLAVESSSELSSFTVRDRHGPRVPGWVCAPRTPCPPSMPHSVAEHACRGWQGDRQPAWANTACACAAMAQSIPLACRSSCHASPACTASQGATWHPSCSQEEDVLRLEEQARKDAEKRATAERRARERRNKGRTTTASGRASRGGATAAASSGSSSSKAVVAAAAAVEAPTISSRAASGAAASTSGTPAMSGAALRSAARTGRVRTWGRAVPVAKPGRGGLSKRAAAAATLEADPLTFMREIGKNQLLTSEQERRLAGFVLERQQLIEAAQRFRRQHGRPPTEEEWAAAAGVEDGAEVRSAAQQRALSLAPKTRLRAGGPL